MAVGVGSGVGVSLLWQCLYDGGGGLGLIALWGWPRFCLVFLLWNTACGLGRCGHWHADSTGYFARNTPWTSQALRLRISLDTTMTNKTDTTMPESGIVKKTLLRPHRLQPCKPTAALRLDIGNIAFTELSRHDCVAPLSNALSLQPAGYPRHRRVLARPHFTMA